MLDQFNRQISYLRLSVTDKCNLRCTYCMPDGYTACQEQNTHLTVDEICEIVTKAAELGIHKIKLTGGEPLMRKDIVEIVSTIAMIEGITDFSLTTNGVLLKKYAHPLAAAGLNRVNVSLDAVNEERFSQITGSNKLQQVFEGIETAKQAGLTPIKINCVIDDSPSEPDAMEVARFCKAQNLQIRYIKKMNLAKGIFHTVIGGEGGNCAACNRIRVTADGKVKPCLFNDQEYSLKNNTIESMLRTAIESKPKCGAIAKNRNFYNVGG